MQVKRQYGNKNKTILCNVPPLLPGGTFDKQVDIKTLPGIEQRFGDFSIAAFMARYLAGNRSLKEARMISRKRMALVTSAVGYMDPEAYELSMQIQRYLVAKKKCIETNDYTADFFLALNGDIAKEKKNTGKVREIQSWVGGQTIFVAKYVCPPPEMVPELFENWLQFINDETYDPVIKAIVGHCRLVSIHPFIEGNGRTARLFMDGMLAKFFGDRVPLLLYRLSPQCPPMAHVETLELLNVGDADGLTHPFWTDALAWSDALQLKMVEVLTQTQKKINGKIALSRLSRPTLRLVAHLWCQPIVCERGLMRMLKNDISAVRVAISELVSLGLLEMRRLKEPQNAVIYDCPLMFNAYTLIDDLVFQR